MARYLGYFVSFTFIGGAWIAHSSLTRFIKAADPDLMRLNLMLLLFVSFLPFTPGLFLIGVGAMLTPSVNVVQSAFRENLQGEISGLSRNRRTRTSSRRPRSGRRTPREQRTGTPS